METKTIKRYDKKSTPELIKIATKWCNKYIRERDEGKGCVSCPKGSFSDAGHLYSAGHYPTLRFNENNIHGQCRQCNSHLHGNLNEYRKGITQRVGQKGLNELDIAVDFYKRTGHKWDRFSLIEIIIKYQNKCKEL